MIHIETFSGCTEDRCLEEINRHIPDDKIINVIPRGMQESQGYDEYDTWTTHYITVVYRD